MTIYYFHVYFLLRIVSNTEDGTPMITITLAANRAIPNGWLKAIFLETRLWKIKQKTVTHLGTHQQVPWCHQSSSPLHLLAVQWSPKNSFFSKGAFLSIIATPVKRSYMFRFILLNKRPGLNEAWSFRIWSCTWSQTGGLGFNRWPLRLMRTMLKISV